MILLFERRWASRAAGFTLIEVLLVLTCAGILAASGVPNLHQLLEQWSLWGSAKQLERTLHWGRMHAIATNRPVSFQADRNGRRFCWNDADTGEVVSKTGFELTGRVRIVRQPRRPVTFHPRGNAAPSGSFVVAGNAGEYRVVVNFAGRIRVERVRTGR